MESAMDLRLLGLFQRQRTAPNARLGRLIAETQGRWGDCLSDDMLGMVAAAGEPELMMGPDPWDGTDD